MNINNSNINKRFLFNNNYNQKQTKTQQTLSTNTESKIKDINDYLKDVDFISLAEDEKNSRINYRNLPNGVSRFNYRDARYTVFRNGSEYKSEFVGSKNTCETEFFKSYSSLKPETITLQATKTSSSNNINGKIDEDVVQGGTGDCWLLVALQSLNSTSSGKKIIQDSIKVNKDNTVTVSFKGIGVSYTLTPAEIKKYDNDVLAVELATEKLWQDINNKKVKISSKADSINDIKDDIGEGGLPSQMIYYLTGIESEEIYRNPNHISSIRIYNILNKAYESGKYAISFGVYNGTHKAKTIDGGDYKLNAGSGHALSITKITKDTVTFVNPWYGQKEEVTMSYKEFANLGIGYLSVSDLSKTKYKENIIDMTGYKEETSDTDNDKKTDNENKTDKNSANKKSDKDYSYYDYEFDYDFNPINYNNNENKTNKSNLNIFKFISKVLAFFKSITNLLKKQSLTDNYYIKSNIRL